MKRLIMERVASDREPSWSVVLNGTDGLTAPSRFSTWTIQLPKKDSQLGVAGQYAGCPCPERDKLCDLFR